MNELVRRGKLKREQIESSPYKQYKNAVTRAVGVYDSVEVDTFDFDILPGDRFLLCSDGLYAYFDEDELPELLADGDVKDVPQAARSTSRTAGGGHDNITAVVIRVGDDAAPSSTPRTTEVSLKLEVLKGMQLFRYLSYKELVRVIEHRRDRSSSRPTQIVFTEGEPGDAMYVVLPARCGCEGRRDRRRARQRPALRRDGLVDRSARSLTATATEPTRARRDPAQGLLRDHQEGARAAVKLLWSFVQVLGQRLRKTTADLSDALHGDKRGTQTETDNKTQELVSALRLEHLLGADGRPSSSPRL